MATLNFLCAGAAQGLLKALQPRFEAEAGARLQGRFGAVGAMKDALLAGEPCDLMIVTGAMVDALGAEGRLQAATRVALGRVRTGLAVPAGAAAEADADSIASADALRARLLAATALYFPDPQRATAGIHFAGVLQRLGIADAVAARCRHFASGAVAMRALADDGLPGALGCTQVSEILYTPGVRPAGVLAPPFELSTVYAGALAAGAGEPALALRFLALLGGPEAQALRAAGGFE